MKERNFNPCFVVLSSFIYTTTIVKSEESESRFFVRMWNNTSAFHVCGKITITHLDLRPTKQAKIPKQKNLSVAVAGLELIVNTYNRQLLK